MRIRRFAVTAAIGALVLTGAACGNEETPGGGGGADFPEGSTMARLNEAQAIKIGTKYDQPGFGLLGLDGKPAGFDVEIGKIIAEELEIPEENIQWMETPSAVREEVLERGDVDIVVATYTINDARKERIDFAGPYYVAGQHIMVKADDNSITGPDSFRAGDKKVCTVQGSTPSENILPYLADQASQLVLFDIYDKCVDALEQGQVDAVTTDNVILLGYVAESDGAYKLAGEKFTDEPYGIGVKKGDDQFRDFINDVLEEIYADGRYEQAWKDTAGQFDPVLPEPPAVDRY